MKQPRTVVTGWASAVALALALSGCFAQVHQSAAQQALAAGRLDEAAAEIQAALEHDPDNPQLKQLAADIFTRRAVKYYQMGALIAAEDDFRRAVVYQPNDARAWDYLGLLASRKYDWQHAIEYGDKAASLEGKPDPAYVIEACKQLRKIRSGGIRPYLPPGKRGYLSPRKSIDAGY